VLGASDSTDASCRLNLGRVTEYSESTAGENFPRSR
jgi:hypothetical protein